MNKDFFSSYKKNIAWLSAGAIFFILDRLLKHLALNTEQAIHIIGDFFLFNFVRNYNIAFSLPLSGWFLNIGITLIIIGLFVYLPKAKTSEKPAIFLILIGAISNFIDRLCYGYVIDYLDLNWFTVFNLADVLICTGTIMLAFPLFKKSRD